MDYPSGCALRLFPEELFGEHIALPQELRSHMVVLEKSIDRFGFENLPPVTQRILVKFLLSLLDYLIENVDIDTSGYIDYVGSLSQLFATFNKETHDLDTCLLLEIEGTPLWEVLMDIGCLEEPYTPEDILRCRKELQKYS